MNRPIVLGHVSPQPGIRGTVVSSLPWFSSISARVVGTAATIWLNDAAGLSAPVNGIIAEFAMTQRAGRGLSMYRLRLVPSLWLLTRTSDCRIFQDKSVQQIVDQVLSDFGVSKKAWRLNGEHQKRDYCVQYRETALDFICRLLEEEGIYFYFFHDDHSHTVVLSDDNRGLTKCSNDKIAASPEPGAMGGIWEWQDTYHFRSSQWALGDYNFETPSTSLTTNRRPSTPCWRSRSSRCSTIPAAIRQKDRATPPPSCASKTRRRLTK